MDEGDVIKEYERRVCAEARRIWRLSATDMAVEDLEQAGRIGLTLAWRGYDSTKCPIFWVYARHRVIGQIQDFVAAHRRKTRGIAHLEQIGQLEQIDDGPSREDASEVLNQVTALFLAQAAEQDGAEQLWNAVDTLPERERDVIQQAYREDKEFKAIADALQIKPSGVCRIHRSALANLRVALEEDDR